MQPSSESWTFGSLLRLYRTNAGLTQEKLAERAGLSRRGIADLERGARRVPHANTIERLARALGLPARSYTMLTEAAHQVRSQMSLAPTVSHLRVVSTGSEEPSVPWMRTIPCHNLPVEPTSFVGRQNELAKLDSFLEASPLITLFGPGGVGKTRLALELAKGAIDRFPDGVWWVELAALSDSNPVSEAVAAVVGVQQRSGVDIGTSLIAWMRTGRQLLVLDNCEHLTQACASLVTQLLHTCPDLRVVVTSRELLGIRGEHVWRVDPLRVADGVRSTATALECEAVKLFVDRATAAVPDFTLSDDNAAEVARVCQHLDGMPLALELAAARLRSLSLGDLAERLGQRFDVLTVGVRDALPRHQSLRALVGWSYDLLDPDERMLFQQLSVFHGGWTLDAAEASCGPGSGTTLDMLGRLVDKSLVRTERQSDGSVRYNLLETVREYAAEQLREGGNGEKLRRRHALFYAHAIVRRYGANWSATDQARRIASIERDYENFRTSLRWLADRAQTKNAELLASSLISFWAWGGRVEEGRVWLKEVLELPPSSPPPNGAQMTLLAGLATLESMAGNRPAAFERIEAMLPAAREVADARTLALALGLAATLVWYMRHDLQHARAYADEGFRVAQITNIPSVEVIARLRLAQIATENNELELADRLFKENDRIEPDRLPRATIELAKLRFAQARYAETAALLEDLVEHYESSRSPLEVMLALTIVSWARLERADLVGARRAGTQALVLVRDHLARTMSYGHVPGPLEALATVAAAAGQARHALQLAGAAAALRERYTEPLTPHERNRLKRWLDPARSALGQRASANAWASGEGLSADAAIDRALSVETPLDSKPDGLSPREREVLLLVAQGLSNRQIGDRLVITEGTARVHVEHVLRKLDLHSRSQLARWAFEHGLYGVGTCLSPDVHTGLRA